MRLLALLGIVAFLQIGFILNDGPGIDPDGRTAVADQGSAIDPNGGTMDSGPGMDPNGATTDGGGAMDPNG